MNLIKVSRIFAFAVVLSAVLSCSKGGPTGSISLSLRQPEVSAKASGVFLEVQTDESWELSVDQSWVKINPGDEKGRGNKDDVILTIDANTDTIPRLATIRGVTASGATSSLVLGQKAKGDEPRESDADYIADVAGDGWIELPATFRNDGKSFITHRFPDDKTKRNFSYYWDASNLVALWVAYPLNLELIGTGSRTNAWGMEPLLPSADQPVLYRGYSPGNAGPFDRGHQLPSADRLHKLANVQTFYGTNMTPEDDYFNCHVWSSLEGKVRVWAKSSDTLYVVTGCVCANKNKYCYDNVGKTVTVPTAYFKACIRYSKTSSIGYNGYMGMATWFDHGASYPTTFTKSMSMSIDSLEEILGYDLFASLPSVVGKETAEKIEKENPADNSWWW